MGENLDWCLFEIISTIWRCLCCRMTELLFHCKIDILLDTHVFRLFEF